MRVLSFVEALLAQSSEIYRATVLKAGSKVYRGISLDNPQMNSYHMGVVPRITRKQTDPWDNP